MDGDRDSLTAVEDQVGPPLRPHVLANTGDQPPLPVLLASAYHHCLHRHEVRQVHNLIKVYGLYLLWGTSNPPHLVDNLKNVWRSVIMMIFINHFLALFVIAFRVHFFQSLAPPFRQPQ